MLCFSPPSPLLHSIPVVTLESKPVVKACGINNLCLFVCACVRGELKNSAVLTIAIERAESLRGKTCNIIVTAQSNAMATSGGKTHSISEGGRNGTEERNEGRAEVDTKPGDGEQNAR